MTLELWLLTGLLLLLLVAWYYVWRRKQELLAMKDVEPESAEDGSIAYLTQKVELNLSSTNTAAPPDPEDNIFAGISSEAGRDDPVAAAAISPDDDPFAPPAEIDGDNPFRDMIIDEIEREQSLYQLLGASFSVEDLRELCFEMHIDYDSLPGEGRKAKSRELVIYCRRNGRLEELTRRFRTKRPHLAAQING